MIDWLGIGHERGGALDGIERTNRVYPKNAARPLVHVKRESLRDPRRRCAIEAGPRRSSAGGQKARPAGDRALVRGPLTATVIRLRSRMAAPGVGERVLRTRDAARSGGWEGDLGGDRGRGSTMLDISPFSVARYTEGSKRPRPTRSAAELDRGDCWVGIGQVPSSTRHARTSDSPRTRPASKRLPNLSRQAHVRDPLDRNTSVRRVSGVGTQIASRH